jgi:hypothetical protein
MPAELQSRLLELLTARGGTVTEVLNKDGSPADSASVLQVCNLHILLLQVRHIMIMMLHVCQLRSKKHIYIDLENLFSKSKDALWNGETFLSL